LTVPGNGGSTALNYTSPVLHTVVLNNLTAGTKYFYQVGDGTTFSSTFNFTSLAAPSELPCLAFFLSCLPSIVFGCGFLSPFLLRVYDRSESSREFVVIFSG